MASSVEDLLYEGALRRAFKARFDACLGLGGLVRIRVPGAVRRPCVYTRAGLVPAAQPCGFWFQDLDGSTNHPRVQPG